MNLYHILILNSPFLPHLISEELMNHYCILTLNNTPLPLVVDHYGVGHVTNYERVNE